MTFTPESILLALFTAVISALGAYLGFYVKGRAEVKAATEDLKRVIENQTELAKALENVKLEVATVGAIGQEARRCIYALGGSRPVHAAFDVLARLGRVAAR